MLFGKLICWVARKRGGKHRYGRSMDMPVTATVCLRCGFVKRGRKKRVVDKAI